MDTLLCTCLHSNVDWIRRVFGECVNSWVEMLSFYLGLSSILCWICAQFPQVYKNYKLQKASALSWIFLLEWLLGDGFNLAGAILTMQLATQVSTAVYFVIMDFVLGGQFFYYRWKTKRRVQSLRGKLQQDLTQSEQQFLLDAGVTINSTVSGPKKPVPTYNSINGVHENGAPRASTKLLSSPLAAMISVLVMVAFLLSAHVSWSPLSMGLPEDTAGSASTRSSATMRTLFASGDNECGKLPKGQEWRNLAGTIVGWASAAFYLGSRVPQIIKNFRRKTCEGLSAWLFFFAVMGNLTYGISIIIFPGKLAGSIPWIVGSLGTLCFDFTILIQYCVFGSKPNPLEAKCVAAASDPEEAEPRTGLLNARSSLEPR